jgi:hypothetical protein
MAKHAPLPVGPWSLEGFLGLPEKDDYRLELVRGHVVREPRPVPRHARVAMRLASLLGAGATFPLDPIELHAPNNAGWAVRVL